MEGRGGNPQLSADHLFRSSAKDNGDFKDPWLGVAVLHGWGLPTGPNLVLRATMGNLAGEAPLVLPVNWVVPMRAASGDDVLVLSVHKATAPDNTLAEFQLPLSQALRNTAITALLTPQQAVFAVTPPIDPRATVPGSDSMIQLEVTARDWGTPGETFLSDKEDHSRLLLEQEEQRERCQHEEWAEWRLLQLEYLFASRWLRVPALVQTERLARSDLEVKCSRIRRELFEDLESVVLLQQFGDLIGEEAARRLELVMLEEDAAYGFASVLDDLALQAAFHASVDSPPCAPRCAKVHHSREQPSPSAQNRTESSSANHEHLGSIHLPRATLADEVTRTQMGEAENRDSVERAERAARAQLLHTAGTFKLEVAAEEAFFHCSTTEALERCWLVGAAGLSAEQLRWLRVLHVSEQGERPTKRVPWRTPLRASSPFPDLAAQSRQHPGVASSLSKPRAELLELPPLFCQAVAGVSELRSNWRDASPSPRPPPRPLRAIHGTQHLHTCGLTFAVPSPPAGSAVSLRRRMYDYTRVASSICPRPTAAAGITAPA